MQVTNLSLNYLHVPPPPDYLTANCLDILCGVSSAHLGNTPARKSRDRVPPGTSTVQLDTCERLLALSCGLASTAKGSPDSPTWMESDGWPELEGKGLLGACLHSCGEAGFKKRTGVPVAVALQRWC